MRWKSICEMHIYAPNALRGDGLAIGTLFGGIDRRNEGGFAVPQLAEMPLSPPTRPYLCQLIVNTWHNFRLAELRAAASIAGVALAIEPEEEAAVREETVFLRVHAADDASVERIAARTVLVRRFVEVWASGDSWDSLAEALRSMPREQCGPYLAEGTTFKVRVEAFGRSLSEPEKIEQIKRLEPLLPWRGKVRLKDPQHTFVLLYDGARGGHGEKPERLYFGRVVASGQRELPGTLGALGESEQAPRMMDHRGVAAAVALAELRRHRLPDGLPLGCQR